MARKKKHDNQEEKDNLPDPASPNAEATASPEAEVLDSGEKPQDDISFEKPTAPAVLPETEFRNNGEVGSAEEAFGVIDTELKEITLDEPPAEGDVITITPEEVEEYVAGDVDLTNPGYEEIKVILSQWNFKHSSNFELKGNILHDNGATLLVDELKRDLKDWYYNLVITDLKNGTHELIFA